MILLKVQTLSATDSIYIEIDERKIKRWIPKEYRKIVKYNKGGDTR